MSIWYSDRLHVGEYSAVYFYSPTPAPQGFIIKRFPGSAIFTVTYPDTGNYTFECRVTSTGGQTGTGTVTTQVTQGGWHNTETVCYMQSGLLLIENLICEMMTETDPWCAKYTQIMYRPQIIIEVHAINIMYSLNYWSIIFHVGNASFFSCGNI